MFSTFRRVYPTIWPARVRQAMKMLASFNLDIVQVPARPLARPPAPLLARSLARPPAHEVADPGALPRRRRSWAWTAW